MEQEDINEHQVLERLKELLDNLLIEFVVLGKKDARASRISVEALRGADFAGARINNLRVNLSTLIHLASSIACLGGLGNKWSKEDIGE